MFKQRIGVWALDCSTAPRDIVQIPGWVVALGLALALTVGGCAINPVQERQTLLAPVPPAQLSEARTLDAKGDAAGAAKYYLDLSEKAKPPTREQLRIEAARTLLGAGQARQARQVLDETSRSALTQGQKQVILLLGADAALQLGDAQQAIDRLDQVQSLTLPAELRIHRLGTLAAAYRLKGQPVEAAEALGELDGLLKDQNQRLANQVSLLHALGAANDAELRRLSSSGSGDLRGWAELALLFGSAGAEDAALDQGFAAWRRAHGSHPALPDLPRAYFGTLAGTYAPGDRVSVLLPGSGGLASGAFGKAIGAIREGILAARSADDPAKRPQVSFVDASKASRARAQVAAAAAGGAGYVIGPLQKDAVDALMDGAGLSVPTLALNRATSPGRPPANLFQYALSPEDEGGSVANEAWAAGHRSALVLHPNAPWAERLVAAFRAQWATLGGRVAGQRAYGAGRSAENAAVKGLLGADADGAGPGNSFVFLVATKDSARVIWPQIQATGGLRTIATSLVYNGESDPAVDNALAGLQFVDIPWMLSDGEGPLSRRALARTQPRIGGSDQRLYAMGIDAYRIAPRATDLARRPGSFFPGQTGALRIDSTGRVHRQLVLGQFTAQGVLRAKTAGAGTAR